MHSFNEQTLQKLLSKLAQHSSIQHEQTVLKTQFRLHFQLHFIEQQQDSYIIELQIKAGTKRLQLIRQPFLLVKAIAEAHYLSISDALAYDPKLNYINEPERSIIDLLARFSSQEQYSYDEWYSQAIVISSAWWQGLSPLFKQSSVVSMHYSMPHLPRLEQHIDIDHFMIDNHSKLPIEVSISQLNDTFIVTFEQMDKLFIADTYEIVAFGQQFYPFSYQEANQLKELKQLCLLQQNEVYISEQTKTQFATHLLPFINKWFDLKLDATTEQLLVNQPVSTHLYLDRVNDKVLVAVEFHYGPYIVKPFKPLTEQYNKIVLRQMHKEHEFLNVFQAVQATKTEEGFVIEGEQDEFVFFYELLPQLKEQATVYATTAIYQRYVKDELQPEIHLTWHERSNWLDFQFQMNGINDADIKACIQALMKKKKYVVLSTGAILSLKQPNYESLIRVMQQLGLTYPIKFDEKIPLFKAVPLMLHDDYQAMIKANAGLRQLLERLQYPDQRQIALPPTFTATLRDYQLVGYKWFTLLSQFNMGGILADEMGLGKTIQAITFLLYKQTLTQKNQLIVAPKSLIYNWQDELQQFTTHTNTIVIEEKEQLLLLHEQTDAIFILSYPFLRVHYRLIAKAQFSTLILDEAQTFKNDHTQTYRAIKHIKADDRFALTGTPIENNRDELFHILSIINPLLFKDKQSYQFWTNEQIVAATRPFMLRRKKSQVLHELPSKIETILTSPLDDEQKKLYASHLAQLKEDNFKHLRQETSKDQQLRILAGITRLRQICCHPALFVDNYLGSSAKLRQLIAIVEQQYREGKRMLIFSQFTSMLYIIRQELARRGFRYFYLDGQTEAQERVKMCEQFNKGERDLFLLSLKAGGTGLNLTGANVVILYDSWWNPSVEQQATDRAHRIGQADTVHIIKLVSEGTVEEKMISLHARKKELIEQLIEEDTMTTTFSQEELISLISEPIEL